MKALIVFLFCGLSLINQAVADAQPTCSLDGLKKLCDSLPASDQPWVQLPGGRFMQNPRFGKLLENGKFAADLPPAPITSAQTADSKKTIKSQFEEVKNQMLEDIRAGVTDANLSGGQKQWMGILKNIKLETNSRMCDGGTDLSSGHFDDVRQVLEICENAGLESMSRLTWLLAHEMGHSIDGCVSQADYYSRNGHLPLPSGLQLSTAAQRTYENGIEKSSFFALDYSSNTEALEELAPVVADWKKRGLITLKYKGLKPEQYPLTPVLKCLKDNGVLTEGGAKVKPAESCRVDSCVSETTSDMWGSRIAGKYLASHPPATDIEKLATISDLGIRAMCAGRPWSLDDSRWNGKIPAQGRYVPDRYRDEVTLLAESNVQSALGCAPDPKHGNCMSKFTSSIRGLSSTEVEPVTPYVPVAK